MTKAKKSSTVRLAAIYFEEHDYLFDRPQTINFGGRYFYNFERHIEELIVTRELNKEYIPNFFDVTRTRSKITSLNAIVGQNGAGKSTILDLIRSQFIEHKNALPLSNSVFLVEKDDEEELYILEDNSWKVVLRSDSTLISSRVLSKLPATVMQTIFYSPHYDYKHNQNFDSVDNHDISFEKYLESDLQESQQKAIRDSGFPYSISQELLFKNSLRQIRFLSSDLVKKKKVFNKIFDLPQHYEPILYFRGYKKIENEWNTPYAFRGPLKMISEKTKDELSKWPEVRKFSDDTVTNQLDINKYILRLTIVDSIVSILYQQMEKKNDLLQDGYFPLSEFREEFEAANALESLKMFLKHSAIKFKDYDSISLFKESTIDLKTYILQLMKRKMKQLLKIIL